MHLEERSTTIVSRHCFGVKALPGTLLGPAFQSASGVAVGEVQAGPAHGLGRQGRVRAAARAAFQDTKNNP